MNEKWRYLNIRISLVTWTVLSLAWILWLFCLIYSLREREIWIIPLLTGLVLAALTFCQIFFITIPYREIERDMLLFLGGYTASGLRQPVFLLSPATEQLFDTLLRMIESDQALNANKRQAQYLALQNQINPHFLYNTLESIRSEAMFAGIDSVANMAEALASFFRYTISRVENMVTLDDELENIRTYFMIQQYRFEDRIRLEIDYDEEDIDFLLKCFMPKLTLQPVVENSIIHGLERKLGSGTVRISIISTDTRLIIQVSDDGVGMPQGLLQQLNHQLSQPVFENVQLSKDRGSIAIVNVNNRIHLLFGEEYGMCFYSTEGMGTDVVITLPVITNLQETRQLLSGKESL